MRAPSVTADPTSTTVRNRILAQLPPEELEWLQPHLTRVALPLKKVIADPGQRPKTIYFAEDAIISILSVMADGSAIESATVGNDGVIGVELFLGAEHLPLQIYVQVPGEAYAIAPERFREALARGGELPRLLSRYTAALIVQMAQASGCNRKHTIEERCSRWLLMTHDRVGRDEFLLTHHILSQMLGVRRATVTVAAGELQRRGLIRYSRGRVTVLDRAGLEAAACECYRIVTAEEARLIEGRQEASPLDDVSLSARGLTTSLDGTPREEGAPQPDPGEE